MKEQEVKEILNQTETEQTDQALIPLCVGSQAWFDRKATRICQLFEPKGSVPPCPKCKASGCNGIYIPDGGDGTICSCSCHQVPPVLSDEETQAAFESAWRVDFRELLPSSAARRAIAKAQRDADVDFYEPIIAGLLEDIEDWRKDEEKMKQKIEQARQEAAREIFEEIEKLWPIPEELKERWVKK